MVDSSSGRVGSQGEKLAKFLARCGVASRRKCEEYIRAGWIQVNDVIIRTPESRVDPDNASVKVRGTGVSPPENFRYIILNKPPGVICTCKPGKEKGSTLLDIVKVKERIFPIGRLDKDTSGLILLTNDGELSQQLTHPSYEKEKEYIIETSRSITSKDLESLKKGVQLDDGLSRFSEVEKIGENRLRVVLTEGRKRQIRRTLKAIRLPVKSLHRLRIGELRLAKLKLGGWRDLQPAEIKLLKKRDK